MDVFSTLNLMLAFITSLSTLSFGMERVYNHHLYFSGLFFIILGVLGILFTASQIIVLITKSYDKNNKKPYKSQI